MGVGDGAHPRGARGGFQAARGRLLGLQTMVPPMVTVPPGAYRIRAWGRTVDGEDLRGELTYDVE